MSRVVLNERGIKNLFGNPQGPVARSINIRAERIRAAAEGNIRLKTDKRTGDLLASLRKLPIIGGPDGYRVIVGASSQHRGFPYALALETGMDPLTGRPMRYIHGPFDYMVPAVQQAGFRRRR